MKALLFSICIIISASVFAQRLPVANVLSDIPANASSEMRFEQLEKLVIAAKMKKVTILTLLSEIQSYIVDKNAIVTISGQSLKKISENYVIGNERIRAFLPIDKIISLSMGDRCDLVVILSSKYSSVVDLGTLKGRVELSTKYQMCSVGKDIIRDLGGIIIKKAIFNAKIDSIEFDNNTDEIQVEINAPIYSPTLVTNIGVMQ